jgi:hypothetical protein
LTTGTETVWTIAGEIYVWRHIHKITATGEGINQNAHRDITGFITRNKKESGLLEYITRVKVYG